MKKLTKIGFLVLFAIINLKVVTAERLTCETMKELIAMDSFASSGQIHMNICTNPNDKCAFNDGSTKRADGVTVYVLKDGSGIGYTTYCRNPNITSGKESETTKYNCVETLLGKDSSESYAKKIYNAGIIQILKDGFALIGNKTTNGANLQADAQIGANYAGIVLALRLYEMMWHEAGFDTNDMDVYTASNSLTVEDKKNLLRGYRYQANLLLDDAEIKKLVSDIEKQGIGNGEVNWIGKFSDVRKLYSWYHVGSGQTITGAGYNTLAGIDTLKNGVLNVARNLIFNGFTASKKFQNTGLATLEAKKESEQSIYVKDDSDGNKIYKKAVTYKLDAKNFASKDAYIKLNFKCDDCNLYNIKYTLYINNTKVNKLPDNLVSYLNKGDGIINFKIEFETSSKNYNCNNIDYTLDLEYYDESINTEAFTYTSAECPPGTACQSFYVLHDYGKDVFEKETLKESFRFCEPKCKDLEKQCELKIEGACEEFKEKYNSTCIECGANIQNTVCSDKDSVINFNEGTEVDGDTCTTEKDTNVLQCIIDNEDDAGNSYQSNIVDNNYCTVWCKEDYRFTLPGNKYMNSGRYFILNTTITGTKTCYTSKIDKDKFKEDYTLANNEIKNIYNKYQNNKTTENKNQLDKEINDLENIIKEYNSCSNWNMNYNFDPKVEFWYQESYMNNVKENTLETNGSIEKSKVESLKCTSDTNDKYTSCDKNWTKDNETTKLTLNTCYKDKNGTYKCGNKDFDISNTVRMKSSITATGKYITPTQFYNIYPSGAIVASKDKIENGSPLVNALPIGLGTKKGVYNYTLKVNNLGEYYDTGDLGRIWGDEDSVISVTLEENAKNDKCNGALVDKIEINETIFEDGVYSCGYVVNCPDCPVVCDPSCELPNCPSGNCPVVCNPSCIFDRDDINISFRPVTPDDLNPNDRPMGPNWNVDGEVDTSLEMKAEVTTKEIEEYGEEIFDIGFTSAEEEFSMEITLDSKLISWIREYNNQMEDKGGYLNNSLECYSHKNNGKEYENIYCYSTFIDKMIKDNKLSADKMFSVKRPMDKDDRENYDTRTVFEGYWTTWSIATVNPNWEINTSIELEATKNYNNTGIGPAWK